MSLPSEYLSEINALTQEALTAEPTDILQFCANYFSKRLEKERAQLLATSLKESKMSGHTFPARLSTNPFGPETRNKGHDTFGAHPILEVTEEDEESPIQASHNKSSNTPDPLDVSSSSRLKVFDGFPQHYGMGRRTSVSAESLNPTASSTQNWTPPFHPKNDDQLERLKKSISGNFLFSHLEDEQSAQVLGAMVEKSIPAKDIKVISQGDQGDFFYVVEKGRFDVYVNPAGMTLPGPGGLGNKVTTIETGGSFGELALMYNAPRAATVQSAESNCTLWALDRVTFRRILMDSTFQRRRLYEGFLEEVTLLSTLTKYERSKIADALETQKFPAGTTIIKEGDAGEAFYLLESGEAEAFKAGTENPVKHYKKGDYFGELALLNDAPRAASVVSKTDVKVATLGKDGFQRLLGPVESIMRRAKYDEVETADPMIEK